MPPYGFDPPEPVDATLPVPSGAGATLPIGSFEESQAALRRAARPELFPEVIKGEPGVGERPGRFGLSNIITLERLGDLAAIFADAVAAARGQEGTAMSRRGSGRLTAQREERAARTEERRVESELRRVAIDRERLQMERDAATRTITMQINTEALKYLQQSEGMTPARRDIIEGRLLTRMAQASPDDVPTLRTMFTDRAFSEDIAVLTPHLSPRELAELQINARSWLTKENGKDLLRTAAEGYAVDDVSLALRNRAINVSRRLKGEGVTGTMDRNELRKSILDGGDKAELALFEGTRFSEAMRKSIDDDLTAFGFSPRGLAADVAKTRATKRVEQEFKPPDLSQDLRDILQRKGMAVDPTKPTAAEITKAAAQHQKDKIAVAAAQGADAAVAKAAAILDLPLSREDAQQLGVPFGTTTRQAHGIVALSPGQREQLGQFDAAEAIIKDIQKYSKRVNTATGPLDRTTTGLTNWIGATLQTNDDAALLESKKGTLSMVIRALGEKGTLNEGDMRRAISLIPSLWDKASIAETKISDLLGLFKSIRGRKEDQPPLRPPAPSADVKDLSDAELKKRLGIK